MPTLLRSLATELAGKIVVDCVNPLGFDKQGPFPLRGGCRVRCPGGTGAIAGLDGHRRRFTT